MQHGKFGPYIHDKGEKTCLAEGLIGKLSLQLCKCGVQEAVLQGYQDYVEPLLCQFGGQRLANAWEASQRLLTRTNCDCTADRVSF